MAGNSIRVNTDQVAQIASNLEGLNKKLTEELTNSKATVDQLANIWEGEAAQATISSFDEFAELRRCYYSVRSVPQNKH